MPRGFFETTAYIKSGDLTRIAEHLVRLCEREGMQRVDRPDAALHQAPALESNRWSVVLFPGSAGWSILKAMPWDLLGDRPADAEEMRFVSLCTSLGAPGCLVSVHDSYPWGQVIVESDGMGQQRLSGWWYDEARPEGHHFYGEPLGDESASHHFELLPELQAILEASRAFVGAGGESEIEIFCRELALRLGGLNAPFASEWSEALSQVLGSASPADLPVKNGMLLHFAWPAMDRPERELSAHEQALAELAAQDHYFYADGAPVRAGDEVVLTEDLKPARVVGVVTVNDAEGMPQVSGVMIEQAGEQWVIWGHAVAESLHLLARAGLTGENPP